MTDDLGWIPASDETFDDDDHEAVMAPVIELREGMTHERAAAAVEAVLEHVSAVDLGLAMAALGTDSPMDNLGMRGFLSPLTQRMLKIELEDTAREAVARKKAAASGVADMEAADLLAAETHEPDVPEILYRTDGHALFYRGKLHNLVGESESGKSWVAAMAQLAEVRAGGRALYIDFEDQARTFVSRLRALGATDEEIGRFAYYSVERSWENAPDILIERMTPTIVVLDGVTEGMGLLGLDPVGTPDAQKWVAWVRRWALGGACVITIDHVVKDKNGQGRWALGSQHKVAGIDGAHYIIEPDGVLRRGHESAIHIKVGKDRAGGVREFAGDMEKDRIQYVGRARFNLEFGAFEIALPTAAGGSSGLSPADKEATWRADLRKFLDDVGEASMTQIEKGVRGIGVKRIRDIVAQMHSDGVLKARPKGTGFAYSWDVTWTPSEASEPSGGASWS